MTAERKMTAKGFLHKASGKVSATAFLAQHREFLTTGSLAEITSPILAKLDAGEVLPTPTLDAIKRAVLAHHLQEETAKQEAKQEGGSKIRKPYVAYILDGEGNIPTRKNAKGEDEDLRQSFDDSLAAQGWCDRRLFDGAADWHGVIESTRITLSDGSPLTTTVNRTDAVARILKRPVGPVSKGQKAPAGGLSFGVKVKGDHFHFSKG